MIDLYEKISNLTEDDYTNHFDIARIMDYADSRGKEALKRGNLAELGQLSRILEGWLSSINKWKERYRSLLIKISRVEQDLQSLSYRIKRMTGEAEKQLIIANKARADDATKADKPSKSTKELPKTHELPSTGES